MKRILLGGLIGLLLTFFAVDTADARSRRNIDPGDWQPGMSYNPSPWSSNARPGQNWCGSCRGNEATRDWHRRRHWHDRYGPGRNDRGRRGGDDCCRKGWQGNEPWR